MSNTTTTAAPKTAAVTTGSTAARLIAVSTQATTPEKRNSRGVLVKALSTNSAEVYIGGSNVSTSNGYPLAAGEAVGLELADASDMFAVSAAAQGLRILYL